MRTRVFTGTRCNKNRRALSAIFCLIIAVSALMAPVNGESGAVIGEEEIVLYPIADSYVDSETPSQNFGDNNYLEILRTENSTDLRFAYVMFDLSDLPSGSIIADARLIIALLSMSGTGSWGHIAIGAHYCQDNSWLESGITWNTRPNFISNITDSWGFSYFSTAESAVFDISDDVQRTYNEEKKLTEVITWSSGWGSATLYSRDANANKLIVRYLAPPYYTVNFKSALESGESENMGYINVSREVDSEFTANLPIEVDAKPTTYNITYGEGYSFVRWETNGGVSVSDPYSKTTKLTISNIGTLKAIGSSSVIEYGYDTGAGVATSREVLVVKFTPVFSGYLRKARFYFASVSSNATRNDFNVSIMNNKRVSMVTPLTVRATLEDEWLDVDLISYNITVYKGVDFYVGIEKTSSGPSLGADYSKPDGNSWWTYTGYSADEWQQSNDADYMIRAVVERAEIQPPWVSTTITCSASPTAITLGNSLTVNGMISPTVSGATVTLTYTKPDATILTRTVTSETNGSFHDAYALKIEGSWNVKASWEGDFPYAGATSSSVSFTVSKTTTSTGTNLATGAAVLIILAVAVAGGIFYIGKRRKTKPPAPPPPSPASQTAAPQ